MYHLPEESKQTKIFHSKQQAKTAYTWEKEQDIKLKYEQWMHSFLLLVKLITEHTIYMSLVSYLKHEGLLLLFSRMYYM